MNVEFFFLRLYVTHLSTSGNTWGIQVGKNVSHIRKMAEDHFPSYLKEILVTFCCPHSCWPQGPRWDTGERSFVLGAERWGGQQRSHLYFLIDLLKHPRDDILSLHSLDLISSWPDIFQKYLLSLCIYPWKKHIYWEKLHPIPHFHYCTVRSLSFRCSHTSYKVWGHWINEYWTTAQGKHIRFLGASGHAFINWSIYNLLLCVLCLKPSHLIYTWASISEF